MPLTNPPDIPGICERDTDLLLLEEVWCSRTFCKWLVPHCALTATDIDELVEVRRSVTQSNGESDLELVFGTTPGRSRAGTY